MCSRLLCKKYTSICVLKNIVCQWSSKSKCFDIDKLLFKITLPVPRNTWPLTGWVKSWKFIYRNFYLAGTWKWILEGCNRVNAACNNPHPHPTVKCPFIRVLYHMQEVSVLRGGGINCHYQLWSLPMNTIIIGLRASSALPAHLLPICLFHPAGKEMVMVRLGTLSANMADSL